MSHPLHSATALVLCVGVFAGCGSSREFNPSKQLAVRTAQRHAGQLLIFPSKEQGPVPCRVPAGGPARSFRTTNGRCTTFVSLYGKWPVLDFIERYDLNGHPERGAYLVVLDPHGRMVGFHERGFIADNIR